MFLCSLTMLMCLCYYWIKRPNYNGCWKCSRKQVPGESQVLWKTCIMQSLRTICAKSSVWSAYTLLHKTPSCYLGKLITTTVSSFKRGRGSPLNVYRRKQFATIEDRYQLSTRVLQTWKVSYLLSLRGSIPYCEWKAAFSLKKMKKKSRITFVLPLPAFPD